MKIKAVLSQYLEEYGIPSATIGILHSGTITDFAVGLMNIATSKPATTDTIYQCGPMMLDVHRAAWLPVQGRPRCGLVQAMDLRADFGPLAARVTMNEDCVLAPAVGLVGAS